MKAIGSLLFFLFFSWLAVVSTYKAIETFIPWIMKHV